MKLFEHRHVWDENWLRAASFHTSFVEKLVIESLFDIVVAWQNFYGLLFYDTVMKTPNFPPLWDTSSSWPKASAGPQHPHSTADSFSCGSYYPGNTAHCFGIYISPLTSRQRNLKLSQFIGLWSTPGFQEQFTILLNDQPPRSSRIDWCPQARQSRAPTPTGQPIGTSPTPCYRMGVPFRISPSRPLWVIGIEKIVIYIIVFSIYLLTQAFFFFTHPTLPTHPFLILWFNDQHLVYIMDCFSLCFVLTCQIYSFCQIHILSNTCQIHVFDISIHIYFYGCICLIFVYLGGQDCHVYQTTHVFLMFGFKWRLPTSLQISVSSMKKVKQRADRWELLLTARFTLILPTSSLKGMVNNFANAQDFVLILSNKQHAMVLVCMEISWQIHKTDQNVCIISVSTRKKLYGDRDSGSWKELGWGVISWWLH